MKVIKKIGFWVCVAASVLIISNSVSGFIAEHKDVEKEPDTVVENVLE